MSWMSLGGTRIGTNKQGAQTINGISRATLSRKPDMLKYYGAALGANKLDVFTNVECKGFCKAAGVVQSGSKDEVISRLMALRFPVPGTDSPLSLLEILDTKKTVLVGYCRTFSAKTSGNIKELALRVVAGSTAQKVAAQASASAASAASSGPPSAKKPKMTLTWAARDATDIPTAAGDGLVEGKVEPSPQPWGAQP